MKKDPFQDPFHSIMKFQNTEDKKKFLNLSEKNKNWVTHNSTKLLNNNQDARRQ